MMDYHPAQGVGSQRRWKTISNAGGRGGFTIIEVMLTSALMSLLVILMSDTWSGLGRSSVVAIARCRVTQEANLAVESFTRDLGGSLAEETAGEKERGRLVGRLIVGGSALWLCYDGAPLDGMADWAAPDTVIVYDVQANQLVRSNQQASTAFVVADHVDQMQLTAQADGVAIDLTFQYRDITRTYSVVAKDP